MLELRHVRQLRGAGADLQAARGGARRGGEEGVTAAAIPRERAATATRARDRWRMGAEARGLVLVMTLVLVFGLAVLYSASAIIADQENHNSWFYVARQLTGVLAGVIAFAIAAKVDAEKLQKMAWP